MFSIICPRRMHRSRGFWWTSIWMIFALGCAEAAGTSKGSSGAAEPPPPPVEVAEVQDGTLVNHWQFLGNVRASARASLAAGESGAITRVRVRIGDGVSRGDVLVEVDSDLAAARVRTASAQLSQGVEALAQAKRELHRLEGLAENVVPEVERERADSKVRELLAEQAAREAALSEAKAVLKRHQVLAPFDGVVAARQADPGDWVKPGDPVLELISTEGLEIIVDASRDLLDHVQVNDEVILIGSERTQGLVTGIVPALDPVSRTLRVRVVPAKPVPWLIAGDSVNVDFEVKLNGGWLVPVDALIVSPTRTEVVRVIEGTAEFAQVVVLARSNKQALLQSDRLSSKDRVIVRGNQRLRPGQPVKVVEG